MFFRKAKKAFAPELSLVCPFCTEVDPSWFTEENKETIPICTSCNLNLMPKDLKSLLATGHLPENLDLEPRTALNSSFSILTILWAYLNKIGEPVIAESPVSWDVWNPEDYDAWPVISSGAFLQTFEDPTQLGCEALGSLSEQVPYLSHVCSNLLWRVNNGAEETKVSLWPKDDMAMLSPRNYQALLDYVEQIREPISYVPAWELIDRLLELVAKNPPTPGAKPLFGAEVSLHTMRNLRIYDATYFKESDFYKSQALLSVDAGTELKPFGPDNAKRLYPKSSSDVAASGPFDLNVRVVSSAITETKLTLVHAYSFKVLVEAESAEQADAIIRNGFFDRFGLTIMERSGQNFLLDKTRGVDWDLGSSSNEESYLFSKLVDLRMTPAAEWEGTAWQSRCS